MTTSLAVATNEADSAALDAITQHHAELVGTVVAHATALLDASSSGSLEGASNARRDLVLFCRGELLPHAIAEEDTLYALARELPGGALLIDAMIADHRVLAELIDDLAGATTPLGASAAAHALRVLFELHVEKENDYVLPALAAAGEVSLAAGLERMHEQFEELRSAATGGGCGCGGGGCGCGGGAGHGHAEPAGAVVAEAAEVVVGTKRQTPLAAGAGAAVEAVGAAIATTSAKPPPMTTFRARPLWRAGRCWMPVRCRTTFGTPRSSAHWTPSAQAPGWS